MNNNSKAMVLASFVADSLALGAHWIYDTDDIHSRFGRIDRYLKPPEDSYHKNRVAGEFTHYGDQAFVLLESVANNGEFDPTYFAALWKNLIKTYGGYMDHASKTTLSNFEKGLPFEDAGSLSTDLGGASRIAPLVHIYSNNIEKCISSARQQTAMTHNNPMVTDSAEFFVRLLVSVLDGSTPGEAVEIALKHEYETVSLKNWAAAAIDSVSRDTSNVIKKFGQSCATDSAFPSVIHLILKYEDNIEQALVENVMAGGDSAARGMLAGAVLGAHLGFDAIPESWITGLIQRNKIETLIDRVNG